MDRPKTPIRRAVAVVICDAVRRAVTPPGTVALRRRRSFGRFGGSTSVRNAEYQWNGSKVAGSMTARGIKQSRGQES
jgi:hypothetical protein